MTLVVARYTQLGFGIVSDTMLTVSGTNHASANSSLDRNALKIAEVPGGVVAFAGSVEDAREALDRWESTGSRDSCELREHLWQAVGENRGTVEFILVCPERGQPDYASMEPPFSIDEPTEWEIWEISSSGQRPIEDDGESRAMIGDEGAFEFFEHVAGRWSCGEPMAEDETLYREQQAMQELISSGAEGHESVGGFVVCYRVHFGIGLFDSTGGRFSNRRLVMGPNAYAHGPGRNVSFSTSRGDYEYRTFQIGLNWPPGRKGLAVDIPQAGARIVFGPDAGPFPEAIRPSSDEEALERARRADEEQCMREEDQLLSAYQAWHRNREDILARSSDWWWVLARAETIGERASERSRSLFFEASAFVVLFNVETVSIRRVVDRSALITSMYPREEAALHSSVLEAIRQLDRPAPARPPRHVRNGRFRRTPWRSRVSKPRIARLAHARRAWRGDSRNAHREWTLEGLEAIAGRVRAWLEQNSELWGEAFEDI